MMYLYNNYLKASYPPAIAKNTGIDPTNVLKGLNGTGWFGAAKSLLNQGVVEKMERGNEAYYRLSEPSPFHRIMSGYLQTSSICTLAYEDTYASA
jgi:predicted transcriptional regulator with HTH domain